MAKIRKRISKKKGVEKPGEILGLYEKAIKFISRKKRPLLFTSGILLVLILTFATIFFLNIYYNSKASALEYEASKYYAVDSPYLKIQMSEEERYKKALSLYQEIVSKYPRTKMAPIALYGVGNCHFQLKMTDEAEKAYTLFIEKYYKEKGILPLVYQKLGYLYKIKGEREKALNTFEKITGLETGLKDFAYIEMGFIREAEGKKEEAIKNYEKVVENFPTSPWFSEAKRRVDNLKK
jgi:tetratricopeptide (TPR) repeat protein